MDAGAGGARAAQLFFVPRRDDRPSEARNLRQAGAAIEQVVNLITMRNASQRRREGGSNMMCVALVVDANYTAGRGVGKNREDADSGEEWKR